MRRILTQKVFSVFASLSIVLQSIYPGALLLARPAFAEEATASATATESATPVATDSGSTSTQSGTVTAPDDATSSATVATDSATPEATPEAQPSTPTTDTQPTTTNSTDTDSTNTSPSTPAAQPTPESEHGSISAAVIKNISAPSLNLDSQTSLGSATISTDKADYSPTDTVIVTGSNFIPNKDYSLEISSTDPPAIDFTTAVKTNDTGAFVYAYQLDGNYRPNYKVEVKLNGAVIASTTFTDSGTRTINSASLGSTTALGGTIVAATVSVTTTGSGSDDDWKSTSWSSDGVNYTCADHGNHTSAGTYSETFDITAPSSTGTYSISFRAHKDDSCGSSGVSNTFTLSNALTVTAWPSWTTPAQCSIDPSDESPSEVDLLGTSSDPAVGFASDASYMYFRERIEDSPGTPSNLHQYSWVVLFQTSQPQYQYLGTVSGKAGNKVQLWANTVNAPDSGGVDFSPLFNDPADSVVWEGPSSTYSRVTSSGGVYFIDWAIPLSELTSRGININTTKFFATSTNANNYNKDHLNCYEAIADLSITKTDSPDPVTSGGTLTYTLSIHNSGPDTASSVIVTDTLPAGYVATSVTPSQGSCSDTSAPSIQCELGSVTNGANATVTIVGTMTGSGTVTNGASVSSSTLDTNQSNNSDSEDTTINVATGTITIIKDAQPNDPQNFAFTTTGSGLSSFSLDDDSDPTLSNTKTFIGITAGSYSVTEGATSGWTLSNINCVDPTQNSSGTGSTANINLAAGETVTCTYTNTKLATLTVKKHVVNDNGGQATAGNFMLHVKSNGSDVSNSPQAGDETGRVYTLSAGTYVVSEDAPPIGYTQTGFSGDCDSQGSITLSAGDNKTCTITNDDNSPNLKLVKNVINDNGGTAVAHDWTLTATGDGGFADFGDSTTFHPVMANTGYVLSESEVSGYTSGSWSCNEGTLNGNTLTMALGQHVTCTIANDDVAPTVTLIKDVINDNGGSAGADSFGLTIGGNAVSSGQTLPVQANTNIALNEAGLTGYGFVSITGEGCPAQLGGTVNLAPGQNITCTITNDDVSPHLIVIKHVINDNGGTAVAGDFTMKVDATNISQSEFTGAEDPGTELTLDAGDYSVSENQLPGYTANYSDDCEGTIEIGETKTCTITNNDNYSKIVVTKFRDDNGNGTRDEGEPVLPNWEMNLTLGDSTLHRTTNANGEATFDLLLSGVHTLSETEQRGYQFTGMSCVETEQSSETNRLEIRLGAETTVHCLVGNRLINPILALTKTNDASGDRAPGDSVTFTLTVTASQGAVDGVTVTDLPAGGFKYRAGSCTATSTERGILPCAPTYASPGVWDLGNMVAGEVVTLTYIADIDSSQQPGLYKDLAWAKGKDVLDNPVLANQPDYYVGTQVNVVKDQSSTTHVNIEGTVLGAATSLPATGGRTIWVVLASLLVGLGALLMALGRSKLVKGPVLAALVVGIALFTFAPQAQAANVSVRIEAPKSPTNQDSFNVNFVALDTLGRDVTVKCFKQAPGDGSPSQFGSDIVLSGGGKSGNCVVGGSVIPAQGTYQFSVTAQAGADPVVDSNTVSVEYKTSNGPDTPVSYTKEQNSSCQFKIKFKTANDGGRTVRVGVYRSTTTSFAIDDSTRVGSVGIGSDAEGNLTNDVPDCSKTYYYAIRAYDSAGNGSGVVGDSVTTTIPGPVLPAPAGAIPVFGGTGTGAVLGGEGSSTETGGILGETTPSAIPAESPASNNSFLSSKKTLAILGLIVLAAAYVFYRRGKQV